MSESNNMHIPKPVTKILKEEIVPFLEERERKGIEHYGQTLHTWNGRDVHKDVLEELIDALQYAVQAREERKDLMLELQAYDAGLSKISTDRYYLILLICQMAKMAGWKYGSYTEDEHEYLVLDLPNGQIAWECRIPAEKEIPVYEGQVQIEHYAENWNRVEEMS